MPFVNKDLEDYDHQINLFIVYCKFFICHSAKAYLGRWILFAKNFIVNVWQVSKSTPTVDAVTAAWNVSVFGVFLVRIFPYSDQKNPEYGHFSRSVREHGNVKVSYDNPKTKNAFSKNTL